MIRFEYCEKTFFRVIPFILTQMLLSLGMVSPFLREHGTVVWSLGVLVIGLLAVEIWIAFDKRPVLVITNHWICLKGLRPGFTKILQLWHREKIQLDEIIDIRVGKIREERGPFRMKVPPLGDPRSSSHVRKFLWVRYCRSGRTLQLYYPHTPQIKNFEDALARLRQLGTLKLVEFA